MEKNMFQFAETTIWKADNVPASDKGNCINGIKINNGPEWFEHLGYFIKTTESKTTIFERFDELLMLIYPEDILPRITIKALTWKQPFADLMLHGKIETRKWRTHWRGWVLICAAAKSYTDDQIKTIMGGNSKWMDTLDKTDIFVGIGNEGHAIAIGRLVDCREMTPEDADACFVAYRPGLWCHIYADVKAIEPIPWKGAQGWRTVPDDVKRTIKILKP